MKAAERLRKLREALESGQVKLADFDALAEAEALYQVLAAQKAKGFLKLCAALERQEARADTDVDVDGTDKPAA